MYYPTPETEIAKDGLCQLAAVAADPGYPAMVRGFARAGLDECGSLATTALRDIEVHLRRQRERAA